MQCHCDMHRPSSWMSTHPCRRVTSLQCSMAATAATSPPPWAQVGRNCTASAHLHVGAGSPELLLVTDAGTSRWMPLHCTSSGCWAVKRRARWLEMDRGWWGTLPTAPHASLYYLVNLHGRAEERYGRKRMSLNSKTGAKWPVLKKFNGKK